MNNTQDPRADWTAQQWLDEANRLAKTDPHGHNVETQLVTRRMLEAWHQERNLDDMRAALLETHTTIYNIDQRPIYLVDQIELDGAA